MSSFNWADLQQAADDAGFTVLPAMKGVAAKVATAEAGKTSTGKDRIRVRFTLDGGPYSGKSVFNDFTISPDSGVALKFFFRDMASLGLTQEWFATNPAVTQVAAALVGRPCLLDVIVDNYNGDDRNKVSRVYPPATGAAAAPTPGVLGTPPTPGVAGPVPSATPVPNVPTTPMPVATPIPAATPVTVAADVPQADAAPPELPF